MADIVKVYSCGVYHPYWSGPGEKNPHCDLMSKTMMDFKEEQSQNHKKSVSYFSKLAVAEIAKYKTQGVQFIKIPFLVTIVPSHTQDRVSPALVKVAQSIVDAYPCGKLQQCLRRSVTVASAHKEGGDRSIDGHMKSIKVNNNNFKGRNVLLLDDVKTTGGSMSACYHLLKQAGAQKVFSFALLETASYEE